MSWTIALVFASKMRAGRLKDKRMDQHKRMGTERDVSQDPDPFRSRLDIQPVRSLARSVDRDATLRHHPFGARRKLLMLPQSRYT